MLAHRAMEMVGGSTMIQILLESSRYLNQSNITLNSVGTLGSGGGCYVKAKTMEIARCTFQGNEAPNGGGGLYLRM